MGDIFLNFCYFKCIYKCILGEIYKYFFSLAGDEDVKYFMEEWYLLRYLRLKKFDVDETYEMIKHYYKQKKERPEVFCIADNMEQILIRHSAFYLPYRDEQGRVVVICNLCNS